MLEAFLEELDAGRRTLARGQVQEFLNEQMAGHSWEARVQERLEEEQAAGRRTSSKFG